LFVCANPSTSLRLRPRHADATTPSIAQENKLGQRYIAASDFLKNGIPASILATTVIVTLGFGISKTIG
jgi:hypothetical protein